jgi:hypothetical protein
MLRYDRLQAPEKEKGKTYLDTGRHQRSDHATPTDSRIPDRLSPTPADKFLIEVSESCRIQ